MAYNNEREDIAITDKASFIEVNNPAYMIKSWPMTRIFLATIDELDVTKAPEISFKKADNICLKWCHSSNLKIVLFKDPDRRWAPTWMADVEVLFFPFHGTFRDSDMAKVGQAIRDVVPEFVDKEVWQTPEEQTAQLNIFKEYLATKNMCSRGSLEDLRAELTARVQGEIKKEEDRLAEHLRPKSLAEIQTSTINPDGLQHVSTFYRLYRDHLIAMSDVISSYGIGGLELQAQTFFDYIDSKSVGKERILGAMGIQWESKKEDVANKKITRNKISACQIPLDFFWSIQPTSRSEGPKPIFLINPSPENKHSNLIAPFGENTRIASVMSGILGYGCQWDTELRSKAMTDSKSVHVMRGVIHEAISQLPADDPLAEHLRYERNPDTGKMSLKDIAISMHNWSCAMLAGYTKYQDALNVVIVDLQGRQPDGQKRRWDPKVIGDLTATLVSEKLPDIEMDTTFADRMIYGDSLTRRGHKCLRVYLKPTTITYDERIYSMGRYVIELNVVENNLMVDFMAPGHFASPKDVTYTPQPRRPGSTNAEPDMLHSHIQGRGVETESTNVERVICLGEAKSRYYNATGKQAGGANVEKIMLNAEHVFDGAPEFIQVKTINPRDLINTVWVLLKSCYRHDERHDGLSMDNWHVRRVR